MAKIDQSEIVKLKSELGDLLKSYDDSQFRIGDLLVKLIDEGGQKLTFLAQEFNFALPTLSQFYSAARNFKREDRKPEVPFSHYVAAWNAENRAVSEAKRRDIAIEPNYVEALDIVVNAAAANRGKLTAKGKPKKGGINQREATEAVSFARREAHTPKPQALAIHGGCHHKTNEELLAELLAAGAKFPLITCDPPYSCYRKQGDGKLDSSTSRSASIECDNATEKLALETTCATIEKAEKVLATNGCILVWQASNCPLRIEILETLKKCNLMVDVVVTWDKGVPQPGAFTDAFALSSELCYVIHRIGERVSFQETGHRINNVISLPPVQHRAGQWDETHFMVKPPELMKMLVKLLTKPGECVLDLFGCTGSMSVAAQKLGRQWIYCESNSKNFELGSRNIAKAVDTLQLPPTDEDEQKIAA